MSRSFKDLPQLVLENIIEILRDDSEYDEWIADLRLVNSHFNEAILHCLIYRRHRRFRPRHYMSCQRARCLDDYCSTFDMANQYYKRYYLLAAMNRTRGSYTFHKLMEMRRCTGLVLSPQPIYPVLSDARSLLAQCLALDFPFLEDVNSIIAGDDRFYNGTMHLELSDRTSIVLCESVLNLLQLYYRDKGYKKYFLPDMGVWFYLRNTACFLGSKDLFELLCHNPPFDSDMAQSFAISGANELLLLLCTAATKGHLGLVRYVGSLLQKEDINGLRMHFALCAACYSGDTMITQEILLLCPEGRRAKLCYRALGHMDSTRKRDQLYSDCAMLLVHELCPQQTPKLEIGKGLSGLLRTQCRINAPEVVRELLKAFQGGRRTAHSTGVHGSTSALWAVCMNASVECLDALKEGGYFSGWSREEVDYMIKICMPNAVKAGSWQVCELLYRIRGKDVPEPDEIVLYYLVEADAAYDAIRDALRNEGSIESRVAQPGILVNAITWLKVGSARVLLENGVVYGSSWHPKSRSVKIEYRYKKTWPHKFNEMQKLLEAYNLPPLEVEL